MDKAEMIKTLAERCRTERRKQGLTQKQLAARFIPPADKTLISSIENGKKDNPTLGTIVSLANALRIEAWELLVPIHIESQKPQDSELVREVRQLGESLLLPEELAVLSQVNVRPELPQPVNIYSIVLGALHLLREGK